MSSSNSSTLAAAPAELDLPKLDEEILELWQENETEARSLRQGAEAAQRSGQRAAEASEGAAGGSHERSFVFNDGPPFATGLPHYGHLLAGTIKDVVPRYQAMRGRPVERRFGWDCHGLPIESLVEKELGIHGRAAIEEYGIDKFNAACRAAVFRYTAEWETAVRRMGRWIDFRNDYKTMDTSFMETVWWVFRQLWDQGLIYEGFRVQPVSTELGTPLSNFEVALGPQEKDPVSKKEGHKRRQDPSLTVRVQLEDEDAFIWAWTTTPWTLPSNLALAVHPELEYVKVRVEETDEVAYVEPTRLRAYQEAKKVGATQVLQHLKGADLIGRPYAPLLPYFENFRTREDGSRWAFRVVGADYVTTDSGTGIVHQAPAFGEDDYLGGPAEGLPMAHPLNLQGVFDEQVPDFEGQYAKDADKGIVQKLKAEGKVVDYDVYVHAYPHCYRTDTPLLYMAQSTWFMKVEQMRERLVEFNDRIHWVPEHVGSGRFGNWLGNARDWNLARSRFWGTPLPVWRSDEPGDFHCIGSVHELEALAHLEPGSITDLHRETIDPITFHSPKTGKVMRRVEEVFDCWFESGSMPYAQNHYPFDESKKAYVENHLPADFIAEGLDQTRGWFYTLHVLAAALFDRPAFENVIVNGLVLAEDGKKMSKSLKNYPDPKHVMERYGADALRAYLISSAVVRAEPMRFAEQGVRDTVRTVILPLHNAYKFLATYANADGWSPSAEDLEPMTAEAAAALNPLDRWILSRVQSYLTDLNAEFEDYALSNLVPAFYKVVDDLNNWYIRRGRRRYWKSSETGHEGGDADKQAAYSTLYRVLVALNASIAPAMPFYSEWLYQRLVVDPGLAAAGHDSVHLSPFPMPDASRRNLDLERDVEAVRQAVSLGLAIREREEIGVRRPLGQLTIASPDDQVRAAVERYSAELKAELNVREVVVTADDGGVVRLHAKANFKALGRRLGKKMKEVAAGVAQLDAEAIELYLASGSVEIGGEMLGEGDVLIERDVQEGIAAEAGAGMTVLLDTTITDDLRREGLSRELINRVQNLRKQADLEVSDRIHLIVACGGELAQVAADPELMATVQAETLADSFDHRPACSEAELGEEHTAADQIDGESLSLAVVKR